MSEPMAADDLDWSLPPDEVLKIVGGVWFSDPSHDTGRKRVSTITASRGNIGGLEISASGIIGVFGVAQALRPCHGGVRKRHRMHGGRLPKIDRRRRIAPAWKVTKQYPGRIR